MYRRSRIFFSLILAAVLAAGCSTTRVLGEDEYQLARNSIKVDKAGVDASELNS